MAKKKIKRTIPSIIAICIIMCILIVVPKVIILFHQMEGDEFVKSDFYYKKELNDINIHNIKFAFNQISEIPDLNNLFCNKYHSYKEYIVGDDVSKVKNFSKFTGLNITESNLFYGAYYYLNNSGNIEGALYRYNASAIGEDNAPIDYTIESCVSTNKILLNDTSNHKLSKVNEISVDIMYDNIYYIMKKNNDMNFFQNRFLAEAYYNNKYYYFYGISGDDIDFYEKIFCNSILTILEEL